MIRGLVLTALVAAATLAAVQAQQPAAQDAKVVDVEKLKDNLFVLKGGGGNTAVFVTTTGVVVEANNGGSGLAIGDTLAKAYAGIKGVDTIITGHSDVMNFQDMKEYSDFNKDFLAWVEREMKAGKSAEAAAAEYTIPATYKGYAPNADQTKQNVGVVYNELKK